MVAHPAVTVSSTVESNNSQIATDGTITYGTSQVTGDVTFTLYDGSVSSTQAVSVDVQVYGKSWVQLGSDVSSNNAPDESLIIGASGTPYLAYSDTANNNVATVEVL